jgi:hypothetical protein
MADQLTDEQIAEFKEAFDMFSCGSSTVTCGLFGRPLPNASPIANPVEVETEDISTDDTEVTRALPLQSVSARVMSLDGFAKIELAYTFTNIEASGSDLEATLFIPKQPKAAICGLRLVITEHSGEQRTVVGVVQERTEAEVSRPPLPYSFNTTYLAVISKNTRLKNKMFFWWFRPLTRKQCFEAKAEGCYKATPKTPSGLMWAESDT